jgi:hypothetical protein
VWGAGNGGSESRSEMGKSRRACRPRTDGGQEEHGGEEARRGEGRGARERTARVHFHVKMDIRKLTSSTLNLNVLVKSKKELARF